MYEIGDGVIHPIRGAGIVTDISHDRLLGEEDTYYVIEMLAIDLKVMVPVDRAEEIGLREAPGRTEANEILSVISSPAEPLPQDYRERERLLASVLGSAGALRKAEVFRDLAWRERRKGRLSRKENELLRRLRRFVSGELALAEDLEFNEARELIEEKVNRSSWQAMMSSQAR
jgi:CarD family transcriptional regulator